MVLTDEPVPTPRRVSERQSSLIVGSAPAECQSVESAPRARSSLRMWLLPMTEGKRTIQSQVVAPTPPRLRTVAPAGTSDHRCQRARARRKEKPMRDAPLGDQGGGWEERLYPGLAVPGIPAEPRAALSESLGALGVEAEHVLLVVSAFTRPGPGGPAARADGERFLWQLE